MRSTSAKKRRSGKFVVGSITHNLDKARGLINNLEDRLNGVLLEQPDKVQSGDAENLVPIADQIRQSSDKAEDIGYKLDSIISRLEL